MNLLSVGKFKLNPRKFNVPSLIENIRKLFEFQCETKGINLEIDFAPHTPIFIISDPDRLSQILINLIGNALKFTFTGGITISVETDPDNTALIKFKVSDTGIGIKPEDMEHLFKAYGKLDDQKEMNKKGIGLGLSICFALVN